MVETIPNFVVGFLIDMFATLKINTALLICSAFVFRLLFLNISSISSVNTRQNTAFASKYFSSVQKRRKSIDVINHSNANQCSLNEICEEDLNNKIYRYLNNSFFPVRDLYFFLSKSLPALRSRVFPDLIAPAVSPRKYLSIAVLRI